jgi:hypothetical protein
MRTGIPADAWRAGPPRDLDTALALIREQQQAELEER